MDNIELPDGWKKVESRSRPGEFSYENIYTGQRQHLVPTKPAKKRRSSRKIPRDSMPRVSEGTAVGVAVLTTAGEVVVGQYSRKTSTASTITTLSDNTEEDEIYKRRSRSKSRHDSTSSNTIVSEEYDIEVTPRKLSANGTSAEEKTPNVLSTGKALYRNKRLSLDITPASKSNTYTPTKRALYRDKRPSLTVVSNATKGVAVSGGERRASYRDKKLALGIGISMMSPENKPGGGGVEDTVESDHNCKSKKIFRSDDDDEGDGGGASIVMKELTEEDYDHFEGAMSPVLDFAKIHKEAALDQSYRFSDNGTFMYKDFEIRPEGISSTPDKSTTLPYNLAKDILRLEKLGKGNGGSVYKGIHLPSFKLMALKEVQIHDVESRHQMLRELKVLQLNAIPMHGAITGGIIGVAPCKYVLGFYDAYTEGSDGQVMMAVEYMDGKSLDDHIKAGRTFTEADLTSITFQCLKGLKYLNQNKQMHRDIKPANILLNTKGRAKIADFGTATQVEFSTMGGGGEGRSDRGMANTFVGTAMYMAPERIDSNSYSFESDVWSIGLSIYTAATGKFPFNKERGYFGLANSIVKGVSPTLRGGDGKWSDGFSNLIDLMLEKDYKKRPRAKELLKHPWIKQAIKNSEHSGLPIPKFLINSMSVSMDFDLSSPKHGIVTTTSKSTTETTINSTEVNERLSKLLSEDDHAKNKKLEEVNKVAIAVTKYYIHNEREKTGKTPREVLPLFEKKLSRLSSDLKLPYPLVLVAFHEAYKQIKNIEKSSVGLNSI